ncbi:hypothetical protein [Actinoplanes awajinensis]|uniref:Alcohol dehydrogenase-like C-terminal domain-containing protein n=1 Tax=Actinoplanes awajinensis subsp. mycoplanecinus TaxID=135947 RepID=A0A101J9G2_9ACTN|nr:hypothetical protein [Actinoplanes awajinensis]KUL22723.1 hypothetical protein ADL15_47530 [Actinoplanes awajinensis subsp. mycoplanecinus]
MGRHKDRTDLGREFGATDVVAERGEEGITKVKEPGKVFDRTVSLDEVPAGYQAMAGREALKVLIKN